MSTNISAAQQEISEKSSDDGISIPSDADSDFEDDPIVRHARDSVEVAEHDHEILDEEEEREKLLAGENTKDAPRGFLSRRQKGGQADMNKQASRGLRRSRKKRKHARGGSRDEEGELMYEMEEGGPRSETSSLASSSSSELDKLNLKQSSMSKVSFEAVQQCMELSGYCTATENCPLACCHNINISTVLPTHIGRLQSLTQITFKATSVPAV